VQTLKWKEKHEHERRHDRHLQHELANFYTSAAALLQNATFITLMAEILNI